VREAKVHTRWSEPNEVHEAGLRNFVAAVVDRAGNAEFCAKFAEFQKKTSLYGMLNGLGQLLLKVACPGVPDIYQGAEKWDFRLVDPDNRDVIDFETRSAAFEELRAAASADCACRAQELLGTWPDSRVKMHVLARSLAARQENPSLFLEGDYRPLEISGAHSDRALAFARAHDDDWAIVIVPRCLASLGAPVLEAGERRKFWGATSVQLPSAAPGRWYNLLAGRKSAAISATDGTLSLADAFGNFPLALLLPSTA
jgi:(1->4)-alpha-D-glucan 1-alpha-D-glucosylmutase